MACCIVFAKLLTLIYRLLDRRGRGARAPRPLLESGESGATRRLLVASAAGELLVVGALIWVISRGGHIPQPDMATPVKAAATPPGWQWAVPAALGFAAVSAASTVMDGRMTRRALAVLAGGVAAAVAVSPPVMQGARASHFVFMTQLELLAVVAPIFVVLGIRGRWHGTAVGEGLGSVAPMAAVASLVTVTVIHLPRIHSAMATSTVVQACAVLAMAVTGALVWLSVLADPFAKGTGRRLVWALVAQEGMAIIGLVLLLSPDVLYAVHGSLDGVDPMLDQRAAGAVALIVDMLVTVPVVIWLAARIPTLRPTIAR